MQYRKMGKLPWEVSALGLGAMRLPKKKIVPGVDQKAAIDLIRNAIDLGVNYIDTAYPYHLGQSEVIVGMALQGGYREKVHLATKLPTMLVRSADAFDSYLNKQLKKLNTDYLDVYLFHHLNQDEAVKLEKFNLLKKMEELKESGIIKHFGFSFHDTLPSFKKIVDMYPWEICQIQYNYMDTGVQATTEGLKYAHAKGLAVVIMEPLRGGYLANPPKEALEIMNKSPIKRTPVDWALQFLWNQPEISVVLSGMSNLKQLNENVESANRSGINSLSQEENQIIQELSAIFNKHIVVPCTACNYCMPCPHGVNIPQNFAFLNAEGMKMGSFENRFMQAFVRMRYKRLAKNKKELQMKPNNGKASLCIKCGACKPKCPQNIDIPTCLEKADLVLSKKKKIEEVF